MLFNTGDSANWVKMAKLKNYECKLHTYIYMCVYDADPLDRQV